MPLKDRLDAALEPLQLLWPSARLHLAALRNSPSEYRQRALARLLAETSPGFIAYEDTTAVPSLVASAAGAVLEVGPGPGNQIHRFHSPAITTLYAVEPNRHFRAALELRAQQSALRDRYRLLGCRMEDVLAEGIGKASMDCVLSIQVLCSVRDPKTAMRGLYALLKPGGRSIFWEHGRSGDAATAFVQACWSIPWSTLIGGCCLHNDVKSIVLAAGDWENPEAIEQEDHPYNLFLRTWGVLVKKS